jgi:hypothetical protein
VLGGGAAVNTLNGQHLLTNTWPESGTFGYAIGWSSASKDQEISYLDTINTYLITIPRCPVGFVGGCLSSFPWNFVSDIGGGYRPATNTITGAVVGVGAATGYHSSAGRLLTAIWPADVHAGGESTLHVDSKDHDIPDSNETEGYQVVLSAVSQ